MFEVLLAAGSDRYTKRARRHWMPIWSRLTGACQLASKQVLCFYCYLRWEATVKVFTRDQLPGRNADYVESALIKWLMVTSSRQFDKQFWYLT